MRPPKPRTQKPNLCWRWMRRAWVPFYRVTWTEDGVRKAKELKLDWKGDAKELDRLYWLARGGQHQAQAKPLPYTWRECIIAWRSDPIVQARLAAGTKQSYRPPMDQILEKNGGKDMRLTTRPAIKAALATMAETPKKASRFAQTISILWNYATNELDWPLGLNPAKKLATYKPRRAYEPWPPWMIDKLPTAPEIVQTAAEIILGTGQRPGAAIAMRRDQIKGDTMALRDDKGDEEFIVHCPARFRAYVDALPRRGAHLIPKNLTQPLTYFAVQAAFSRWRASLGENAKTYSLHGLRKFAIIELAEAGCSDAEIQAITNQSPAMVAYYRQKASRLKLSRSAYERTKNEP